MISTCIAIGEDPARVRPIANKEIVRDGPPRVRPIANKELLGNHGRNRL